MTELPHLQDHHHYSSVLFAEHLRQFYQYVSCFNKKKGGSVVTQGLEWCHQETLDWFTWTELTDHTSLAIKSFAG